MLKMSKNLNIRKANTANIVKIMAITATYTKVRKKQKFFWSELALNGFKAADTILVAELDNKIVGYIWFVWYEHIKEKGVAYFETICRR